MHQRAVRFAQGGVGVAAQLQRVRQGDQIEAAFGKRQRGGVGGQQDAPGGRSLGGLGRIGRIGQGQPAVGHAVGGQGVDFRQAQLQGVVAENIGHGGVELRLLPAQQGLAGRGAEPIRRGHHRSAPCAGCIPP